MTVVTGEMTCGFIANPNFMNRAIRNTENYSFVLFLLQYFKHRTVGSDMFS